MTRTKFQRYDAQWEAVFCSVPITAGQFKELDIEFIWAVYFSPDTGKIQKPTGRWLKKCTGFRVSFGVSAKMCEAERQGEDLVWGVRQGKAEVYLVEARSEGYWYQINDVHWPDIWPERNPEDDPERKARHVVSQSKIKALAVSLLGEAEHSRLVSESAKRGWEEWDRREQE
jgi:hypothetical protein